MARLPVIKAVNLEKSFQLGGITVTALGGVNLEIYSGEFVVFFGPSGCGKSTLMSMIAGLQPPTKGKVYIRGEDLTTMDDAQLAQHRRTKIGMVFQQFNLISTMNVVENIALPLAFARIDRKRRLKRAEDLLETVGLSEYKKHTPSELSGGQQQRISCARSLVANPWIILADEPTGNLDSKSADEVMRLLISLNRKSKRTVILITHNPDYLIYADRVFHIRDGRVVDVEVNKNVQTTVVSSSKKTVGEVLSGKKSEPTKIKKINEDTSFNEGKSKENKSRDKNDDSKKSTKNLKENDSEIHDEKNPSKIKPMRLSK